MPLPPEVEAGLHRLALDMGASCTAAWRAVESNTGWFSTVWQTYIVGSESTAAAGRAAASAQCNLAQTIKARVDKIIAAGDLNAARELVNEATTQKWADVSQLQRTMSYVSLTGGVTEVGGATLRQIANPFGVPLWLWVAGGLAAFLLLDRRK